LITVKKRYRKLRRENGKAGEAKRKFAIPSCGGGKKGLKWKNHTKMNSWTKKEGTLEGNGTTMKFMGPRLIKEKEGRGNLGRGEKLT